MTKKKGYSRYTLLPDGSIVKADLYAATRDPGPQEGEWVGLD